MTCTVPWWLDTTTANAKADRTEAQTLGLTPVDVRPRSGFYIARADDGALTLFRVADRGHDDSFSVDLTTGIHRRGISRKTSLLARACGLHRRNRLKVLDTTTGLGRDSATLAGFGCPITAIERHPVPAALARDALRRAQAAGVFGDRWSRIFFDDARQFLERLTSDPPDVILIDPMFFAPRRQSKPQKIMTWLHEIIGFDEHVEPLVATASAVANQRVVVKRHARQESLGTPDLTYGERAIRFDVYLKHASTT